MNLTRKQDFLAVKSQVHNTKMKKTLGAMDLVMLGLGGIIGTGIFVLTGIAAAKYAGPSVVISFALGAVVCIFTALAYAELAVMLPVAGNAYSWSYVTLGEVFASQVGWLILMINTFGAATVAAGWSGYMVGVLESFGVHLPQSLTRVPSDGGMINLPAVLVVGLLSLLLVRGTKEATRLNGILVVLKLGAIALFVVSAYPHVNFDNWANFAPHGFMGIAAGAGFVFMAYNGFDALASTAEECKNPNRDLPLGIIGSLVGSAILYVIVAGILTLIVPYMSLNNPEPMAQALRSVGVQAGAKIVAAGAIAGMTTVMLTQIYAQSRAMMMMARDGLFPERFQKMHPKFTTPYQSILLTGVVIILISGFLPVATLGQIGSMSALAVFSIVSISVMIMRKQRPNEHRVFKCPAVYFIGTVSTLLCLFLFIQLFLENWLLYLFCSGLGFVVYFLYGYRNSQMNSRLGN